MWLTEHSVLQVSGGTVAELLAGLRSVGECKALSILEEALSHLVIQESGMTNQTRGEHVTSQTRGEHMTMITEVSDVLSDQKVWLVWPSMKTVFDG